MRFVGWTVMRKGARLRAAGGNQTSPATPAGNGAGAFRRPARDGGPARTSAVTMGGTGDGPGWRAAGQQRRTPAAQRLQRYPADELAADFKLACLSRALDDREIVLQKQSRVFFQISGTGHEILLTALARSLRPGRDWFFPYYRDRALVLALGVTPLALMEQAVGSADDPASGGRQMPCHFGDPSLHIVTQSSPTGSQCLPAVGCAEAGRYIVRRPSLPGCEAEGDELTYVSLGEGATSEGEFWESLNTACRLHLPVLYVVADNGYAISVRAADQAPAPVSEGGGARRRPGARRGGSGPRPRPGHPPLLALLGRHPGQVPPAIGARGRGGPRPHRGVRAPAARGRHPQCRRCSPPPGRGPAGGRAGSRRGARRATAGPGQGDPPRHRTARHTADRTRTTGPLGRAGGAG